MISHLRGAGHVPTESRAPSEHSPGSSLTFLVGHGHLTATKGDEGVARGHNVLAICVAAPCLHPACAWQAAERTGSEETGCPLRAGCGQQGPHRVHASTPDL